MSETPVPAEPYICPHCEATHEHDHVDERAVVGHYRTRLAVVCGVRALLVLLAVAGVLLWLPPTAGLTLVGAGVLAWVLATAAGLLVASVDLARRGGDAQQAASERRLVTVSVLTGAALTPVLALLVALVGRAWADEGAVTVLSVSAAAATGWLAGSAGAEVVRALRLRSLLVADTRAGEVARASAVRHREHTGEWRQLGTVVATALLVGLWVALCQLMPVVAVVLVPLHLALVAGTRRLVNDQSRTR
ncbi:MAG TPA: hypothetical protein H9815_03740 [Candidatus Ruania gallistercoris]|uniref:Uncharacterized protein n=1 Tax=Candidatus Ruania gallistercoris TaxID=2838746 RepID=A0A9D2J335_9MICO|nr:hypothetical protein [Candidatus Ruania gallistercoris]